MIKKLLKLEILDYVIKKLALIKKDEKSGFKEDFKEFLVIRNLFEDPVYRYSYDRFGFSYDHADCVRALQLMLNTHDILENNNISPNERDKLLDRLICLEDSILEKCYYLTENVDSVIYNRITLKYNINEIISELSFISTQELRTGVRFSEIQETLMEFRERHILTNISDENVTKDKIGLLKEILKMKEFLLENDCEFLYNQSVARLKEVEFGLDKNSDVFEKRFFLFKP